MEVVKALLDKNASIELKTKEDRTPLHYASMNGHFKVFKALLDKNASIEAMTKEGETPLHLDLLYGHFEVVKNASTGSKTKDQIIAESLTSL